MERLIKNKNGITLVEVIIAVAISAVVIVVTMKLLSMGMKGSTKGLSHQQNLESASIIMSQIEYDLMKAVCLIDPPEKQKDTCARWLIYDDLSENKLAYVSYDSSPEGGVTRVLQPKNGRKQTHVFAKERSVKLNFTRVKCSYKNKQGVTNEPARHAVYVELTVKTQDKRKQAEKEQFTLNRLIHVNNNIVSSADF